MRAGAIYIPSTPSVRSAISRFLKTKQENLSVGLYLTVQDKYASGNRVYEWL